jgi:pilus assembly protein TadC
MGEKQFHYSPSTIAALFGIERDEKDSESEYSIKEIVKNDAIGIKLRFDSAEKSVNLPEVELFESKYPTKGVVTVGVLMSIIGFLLFSPFQIPQIYRYIGGVGFFIVGVSVLGNGYINSRKK